MSLKEVFFLFLRIGATAFGGPAAHIAIMEEEFVRRRGLLAAQEFLDLMGATNLIPGPNSTEMAIHIGYRLKGWRGLIAAGVAFILPAFFMVGALAWFYVNFGNLPLVQFVFLGVKPVIIAVVAQAILNLSRTALKSQKLLAIGLLSLGGYLTGMNEVLILLLAATISVLTMQLGSPRLFSVGFAICGLFSLQSERLWAATTNAAENSKSLAALILFFLKVGSILFGSGYVLIAFLQSDLVEKYQWITQTQLLDAITVGQFTPGPVFTTATFIGYLVAGGPGALAATLGIFLPSFFFVALTAPHISSLRKIKWTSSLLDGLNAASLALMLGATLLLGSSMAPTYYAGLCFLGSLILLVRFKVNSLWLILVGGVLGAMGLN